MFTSMLLPVLQLKHLQGLFSKSQIRKALRTMPKDPFSMYDTTIERIKRQGTQRSELALTVLGWISHAQRPLLIDELRNALAVDFSESENYERVRQVDVDNLVRPQLLVDICAGLITIEQESKIVRLVHFTTQEYFNKNSDLYFPDVPAKITGTCLTYLLIDEFEEGPCLRKESLQKRLDQYPFYEYAASHWGNHARGISETKFLDLILELVNNNKKLCASVEACNLREPEFFRWCNLFGTHPDGFGPLHCAASQGLDEAIKVLLAEGKDPYEIDGTFKTPVHWAAWRGHCSSLRILLDTGFEIHTPSEDGFLLLETAVDQGRDEAVRLLLDRGFEINRRGFGGSTALLTAAIMGRESLIDLLLEREADCQLTTQFGETALMKAVLSGQKGIARRLLSHGASVTSTNSCGNTALHCAAYTGQDEMIDLFLEAGADVNLTTTNGDTALHLAANRGHESIVRYLVGKGANIEVKTADKIEDLTPLIEEVGRCIPEMVQLHACGRGATPLFEAALHAHENVFHCLVSLGACLDTKDADSNTLLMATAISIRHCSWGSYLKDATSLKAIKSSALSLAEFLIGHGADINGSNKSQATPLLLSAEHGFLDLLELLVKCGADLNAKTEEGSTMLHLAAFNSHADVVDWLINRGVELELTDKEGCTALHLASHSGALEVARMLLDSGAKTEVYDQEGRTPLLRAVWSHSPEYVQFLLDRGADAGYRVFHEIDALYSAALNDEPAIMKVLIGENADLVKVLEERMMIHLASERGDDSVVRNLVKYGVSITSEDENGDMAIHYAAGAGQIEVIRYLLEAGAQIDAPGNFKRTPLLYAAMEGRDEVVVLLCEKGATVDYSCSKGSNALGAALSRENFPIAILLVERGAKLDDQRDRIWEAFDDGNCRMLEFLIQHWDESSPIPDEIASKLMQVAAEHRDIAFAKFLIERGYPVDSEELSLTTSLTTAIHSGSLEMVEYLLDNGAKTAESFYINNPVHLALRLGDEEIAQCLAERNVEFQANKAMFIAIREGLYSFASKLLVLGADAPFRKLEDRDVEGNTLLHVAGLHGRLDCARLLLDNGADTEATNLVSETPLFSATVEVSKLLLERGANVSAMDENGRTPLHSAVRSYERDTSERIELLISHGADVNAGDSEGDTSLHFGCKTRWSNRVALLLAKGADISAQNNKEDQPIHVAVQSRAFRRGPYGDEDSLDSILQEPIELLLKQGADINARGMHQHTPLHMAVEDSTLVEHLLREGADIEAEDDKKMTPLLYACVRDTPTQTFEILLRHGADMYKADNDGHNALKLALENGTYQGAEVLLKHGFPATSSSPELTNAELHRPAASGYTRLLSLLLQRDNVDVEAKNEKGILPLCAAITEEQFECVQLLLKHGADPCGVGICGCPKEHYDPFVIVAARESSAEILLCLVEHGADPNVQNHHNNNALMWAAERGNTECVTALLGIKGLELNAVDDTGDTALNCAAYRGQFEATRLLLLGKGKKDMDREIKNKLGRTAKETAAHKRFRNVVRLHEADEKGLDLNEVEAYISGDDDSDYDNSSWSGPEYVVRRRIIYRSDSSDGSTHEARVRRRRESSDDDDEALGVQRLKDEEIIVVESTGTPEIYELPIRSS